MKSTAFVTGASGFVGRQAVSTLLKAGFHVRAGVHNQEAVNDLPRIPECEIVQIDICDERSLARAFHGIDHLYHFAASVSAREKPEKLQLINTEGTRKVWEAACDSGVKKALYCSTTAVYGLLGKNGSPIEEDTVARAVEPYGRSKLMGERVARELGKARGLETIIIRPAAVFGADEHTHLGSELRNASFSRLILSGGFRNRKFSFVYVEDVAEAALYLMQLAERDGDVFNIAVEPPISYEEAFRAYLAALDRAGAGYLRPRLLARVSSVIERFHSLAEWLLAHGGKRIVFKVWRPGFDMTYSSGKLRAAEYRFRQENFEDMLLSCIRQ